MAALLIGAGGLTSCNLVFEEGKSTSIDAPKILDGTVVDPNIRISKAFTAPMETSVSGGDPTLAFNETELWSVNPTQPYDLQTAKPPSTPSTPPKWTNVSAAATLLNGDKNEVEPALTKDGSLLAFASDRSGGVYTLFLAKRNTISLLFDAPIQTNLTFPTDFRGFDMSPDGLKLYIFDNGMLRVMKRSSLNGEFVFDKMINLPITDFSYPSVSFDELEILYNEKNTQRVMHVTLAADKNSYEKPSALAVGETCMNTFNDADFSADAMTVVYRCDSSIHIARRQ